MAVYEVFSHPELRRYKTHICSKASIILVVVLFVTVIPPLFVVYRSYGFWLKEGFYEETPDIEFKRQLLLVLELENEGDFITYSTYQRYNQLQQQNLRVPLIQSREEDWNRDGKADGLDLHLEMPLQDPEKVTGVKLILIFQYKLFRYSTFTMECMAYIYHDSAKAGSKYEVFGDLKMSQRTPLAHRGTDDRFDTPVVNSASVYAKDYEFSKIFKEYTARNVTTYLQAPYTSWITGRGAGQPFVISANITYPEERYLYTTGFWYMIKWGWIQYVSVLLIFLFLFDRVKVFIYQNQLVQTIVETPFRKEKMQ
ncbi:transmembrane protein 231-like isoform X1 [Mytilus galloprovincialis]|uniref:Transmembrane protein 231 n=1 Tax=Mytilus galloprovincialis TaxID=29158 RepID=A0A8B6FI18_MYTGA|nr:transmembrane protein 231 [Mytilus galloprovincialis]